MSIVRWKIIHTGLMGKLLKNGECFLPSGVHLRRSLQWAFRMTFRWSVEQAYLSTSICVPFLYHPFSCEQPSTMCLGQPQKTHTHTPQFSTSKPSIKTGLWPWLWTRRDAYPNRFYISWPLNSVRRHSGLSCFWSVGIKTSLSHESTNKDLKKEFKNLRCLPPGPVFP